MRVWLAVNTLGYSVDGYFAELLNWGLGFDSIGADLVWLDSWNPEWEQDHAVERVLRVQTLLAPYGFDSRFALFPSPPAEVAERLPFVPKTLDDVNGDDVLVSIDKALARDVVRRFQRSALVDYDPGITQGWIRYGSFDFSDYSVHFTTGEGVPEHDAGIRWRFVPPCVALEQWPVAPPGPDGRFTTVSHWREGGKWYFDGTELVANDKRQAFLPFLELPRRTSVPLELALPVSYENETDEYRRLEDLGWRVRDSVALADLPDFHAYVRGSLGMFSCVKPAYARLETAFVHGLTPCFLATGKPTVVEYTGPSTSLPNGGGVYRFRSIEEAAEGLEAAVDEYDENCRRARAIAEEHFDARNVVMRVLEEMV